MQQRIVESLTTLEDAVADEAKAVEDTTGDEVTIRVIGTTSTTQEVEDSLIMVEVAKGMAEETSGDTTAKVIAKATTRTTDMAMEVVAITEEASEVELVEANNLSATVKCTQMPELTQTRQTILAPILATRVLAIQIPAIPTPTTVPAFLKLHTTYPKAKMSSQKTNFWSSSRSEVCMGRRYTSERVHIKAISR